MQSPIRVVVADDHPLVRAGIRMVIKRQEDIDVVGEAASGAETIMYCEQTRPDVVVMDLSMPDTDPLETIALTRSKVPQLKILIVSAYSDGAVVRRLVQAGVAGYMVKNETPDLIVEAIRTVAKGGTWFSRTVIHYLTSASPTIGNSPLSALTPREEEVLRLLAQGLSNIQIARSLHLAEQTVRNYTSRIYEKLGISSRAEAVVWSHENGLMNDNMMSNGAPPAL